MLRILLLHHPLKQVIQLLLPRINRLLLTPHSIIIRRRHLLRPTIRRIVERHAVFHMMTLIRTAIASSRLLNCLWLTTVELRRLVFIHLRNCWTKATIRHLLLRRRYSFFVLIADVQYLYAPVVTPVHLSSRVHRVIIVVILHLAVNVAPAEWTLSMLTPPVILWSASSDRSLINVIELVVSKIINGLLKPRRLRAINYRRLLLSLLREDLVAEFGLLDILKELLLFFLPLPLRHFLKLPLRLLRLRHVFLHLPHLLIHGRVPLVLHPSPIGMLRRFDNADLADLYLSIGLSAILAENLAASSTARPALPPISKFLRPARSRHSRAH